MKWYSHLLATGNQSHTHRLEVWSKLASTSAISLPIPPIYREGIVKIEPIAGSKCRTGMRIGYIARQLDGLVDGFIKSSIASEGPSGNPLQALLHFSYLMEWLL